jgi:hypothetical protein
MTEATLQAELAQLRDAHARVLAVAEQRLREIERLQKIAAISRENRQNGGAALRMIRETIETLGPPGALPSEEAVLGLYGPEPVHEATAICEALRKLLGGAP